MFLIFLRHILDVPFYHPACQPTYLSIYQLIYQPVNLPVCWPTYPSVWLSFCPRKRNNFLGVVYYGLNLLFNEKKSCRDIAELLTWLKSVARKHFNHLCVHVHTHAHIHIHTQHPHTLHTHTHAHLYTHTASSYITHSCMHTHSITLVGMNSFATMRFNDSGPRADNFHCSEQCKTFLVA